jgi:hypothetical protein
MESGEDEEDWERRDVQRQAQKKAKLLPTRQVSSPFFSFASTAPVTCPAYLKTEGARFLFPKHSRLCVVYTISIHGQYQSSF